jgi:aminoglycoside phosphotransferase family enzyme
MASVESLKKPTVYRDLVESDRVEYMQTHLSMVFLIGEFAFKVKKAVRLGPPFADQSTLRERERLCREELRKNRRGCW